VEETDGSVAMTRSNSTWSSRRGSTEPANQAPAKFTASNEDETAGLLFIGGMAELVTAWLDGTLKASADEIVDAASRALLGLYR
jgi:hypothetical protein